MDPKDVVNEGCEAINMGEQPLVQPMESEAQGWVQYLYSFIV